MKRFIKSLFVVNLFVGMAVQAWGQSSTEGKEFWVSSTLVCSPDKATPAPYIAISAEKACTVNTEQCHQHHPAGGSRFMERVRQWYYVSDES